MLFLPNKRYLLLLLYPQARHFFNRQNSRKLKRSTRCITKWFYLCIIIKYDRDQQFLRHILFSGKFLENQQHSPR